MNYRILTVIFILLSPVLAICQNRWEVTFGIPDDDNYLFNKTVDYDTSILINWRKESGETNNVSKIDVTGIEIWRKPVLNNGYIAYLNVVLSDNQQTIIGGSTEDFPFIMSLDKCYNINWCSKFVNSQLFDHGHFVDAVFMENGDILTLAYFEPPQENWNNTDRFYLFYYNSTGELLWFRLLAAGENYPLIDTPLPMYLTKFSTYYIVSGYCWYPFPDNPDLLGVRPLFIRIDSYFNEKWVLIFGVQDDFIGMGSGVIEDKLTGENIGVGRYAGLPGVFSVTPIMHFDSLGNKTGVNLIFNDSIGANIQSNSSLDIINVTNNKYLLSSSFGTATYGNPFGEILLDSTYRVISSLSHENTDINDTRIDAVTGEKFMFGVNVYENPPTNYNRDILLYSLNSDLSQADYDTTTHVYDSLCDHPIVSDTIYLNGCDVITGIEDVATPEEYYASMKTIPISISPNPATVCVRFEMENTVYHKGIVLQIFGINGNRIFEQSLASGQSAISTSVAAWPDGLYIAVVSSSTGGSGSAKFVVKK
ncbi:MAG: hypothetical protein K9G61_04280 [Bacteroidales bacterium]|nr:hypothetical protein [Bacteroidales bacterium]